MLSTYANIINKADNDNNSKAKRSDTVNGKLRTFPVRKTALRSYHTHVSRTQVITPWIEEYILQKILEGQVKSGAEEPKAICVAPDTQGTARFPSKYDGCSRGFIKLIVFGENQYIHVYKAVLIKMGKVCGGSVLDLAIKENISKRTWERVRFLAFLGTGHQGI